MNRWLRRLTVALLLATATTAQAQPPRDVPRIAATGTAVISGVLLTDRGEPRPLRRARVSLSDSTLPIGRTVITGDDGAFRFEGLAAGSYSLVAVKEAYVPVSYGAARPNRLGTPIVVRDGEARQVTLRMPRGGVITGTVTGPDGQPIAGISVAAMVNRYNAAIGERRLSPAALSTFGVTLGINAVTDDRGVYRLYGLPPGDYFVTASVRPSGPPGGFRTLSDAEIRRALADVREQEPRRQPGAGSTMSPAPTAALPTRRVTYSPVFFPGTTALAQATAITLAAGDERAGVDIPLQYVAMARVEGLVTAPAAPGQQASVRLMANQPIAAMGSMSVMPGPDGTFAFHAVPPGSYQVVAQSMTRPSTPGASPAFFTATTEVTVSGEDIGNVVLTLQPGVTLSGRIAFEGGEPPAVDFTKLRIQLPLTLTGVGMPAVLTPLQLDATGRFTIPNVATGVFRVGGTVQGLRTPLGKWWLKSIAIDGREVLDRPIEIRQGSENVVVTFSSTASAVSGAVRDAKGLPAGGAYAVIFSTDQAAWFVNSRRVAGIRVAADGTFSVRNLPAGEYFVVATDDIEQGEWFDPQVLQRLAGGAMRVSLGMDEQKTMDVTVR